MTAIQSKTGPLRESVDILRQAKRRQHILNDWFYVQEILMDERERIINSKGNPESAESQAELLCRTIERMPIDIPYGAALAGRMDGAFSPSYALINPTFKVESFGGYCDPSAIYSDISPDPDNGLTQARVQRVRDYWKSSPYVKALGEVYKSRTSATREALYFMEPVTGHTIPDFRPALAQGIPALQAKARSLGTLYGRAMAVSMDAVLILAKRYRALAEEKRAVAKDDLERFCLDQIIDALAVVPESGAQTLAQAAQFFTLLWEVMVIEQAPNPYAFSVGNLDRILSPYWDSNDTPHDEAVEIVRHLLCFFQVGDRCWAISQNVLTGGRDVQGNDMTLPMTRVVLDAFFASNDPQPAFSVKLHKNTPDDLYADLGRFFFTPGHSTPSLFNDDVLFENLRRQGIAEADLADYSVAGCQEPLIMGKSSLNTTNTWLNLAKALELALNDGCSFLTGERLGPSWNELGVRDETDAYSRLDDVFYKMLDSILPAMAEAGNDCTRILGTYKPVPFCSSVMEGLTTGRDMRDPKNPGVSYSGSGCLIHGLAVVADSLSAVRQALDSRQTTAAALRSALNADFNGSEPLREFLARQDHFGNGLEDADAAAARIVADVSQRVSELRNDAGQPFLADWSTPSTHLLYGYWVGATPNGRKARETLNYGIDPSPGASSRGFEERVLSAWRLPYYAMTGGCASHFGIDPTMAATANDTRSKGLWLKERVLAPYFRWGYDGEAPFYMYLNVDGESHLREVLRDPKRYAPSGIYIVRIHGTFVNFLDLSPAIQEDILCRLEQRGKR